MKQFRRTVCLLLFSSISFHVHTIRADTPPANYTDSLAHEYLEIAKACAEKSEKDKAITYYEKALESSHLFQVPVLVEMHIKVGNLYREKDAFDPALKHYVKAIELQPTNIMALMELGNTLNILDYDEESITLYMRVLELKPDLISALHNFAFTLKKLGRNDEAIKVFKKVLQLSPNYALAHFNLSAVLLSLGQFTQGWKEYEFRWRAYGETPKRFAEPMWDGCDIAGKRLFIYSEQGLGDTFRFIRYAKVLKEKGAYIIFETQPAAAHVLSLCPYIDELIIRGKPAPKFDYQIALMSLPYVLNTTMETVPHDIPYLYANPTLVAHWKEQLAGDKNFKIGICWNGNGNYPTQALRRAVAAKSIPLQKLAALAKIPNASLYSLQRVDGLEQLIQLDPTIVIHQFPAGFDERNGRFMDTAAVMKNLDLVLSVDTSIIHLAAGLDVPAFLMLPKPADWRWIVDSQETPWYPKLRIFQQSDPGNWDSVIEMVIKEVQKLAQVRPSKLKRGIVDLSTLDKNIAMILATVLNEPPVVADVTSPSSNSNQQPTAPTPLNPTVAQTTPPTNKTAESGAPTPPMSQPAKSPTTPVSYTELANQKVKEAMLRRQQNQKK